MNITPIGMYWLVKLDDICFLHGILFVMSIIWTLIHGVRWIDWSIEKEHNTTTAPKMCAWGVAVAILVATVATFIPSTKQMAAILIVPKIANSEKVQTIGNKVYDLAVEWMEELKPNKKESEVKNGK